MSSSGWSRRSGVDGINVDVEALPIDLVPLYGAFVGRLRDGAPRPHPGRAGLRRDPGQRDRRRDGGGRCDRRRGPDLPDGLRLPRQRARSRARRRPSIGWTARPRTSSGRSTCTRRSASRSERLLLGLPLYGVTWPVIAPGFLAPSTGRGDAWVPRRNLRVFEDPTFAPTYEPTESVEFYSVPTAFATAARRAPARSARRSAPEPRARSRPPGTPSTTTRRAA